MKTRTHSPRHAFTFDHERCVLHTPSGDLDLGALYPRLYEAPTCATGKE